MPRCSPTGSCGCAMGHVARLIEPVVLFLIVRRADACGYELASEVDEYAPSAAGDRTALYRCLRHLEANGHLTSRWELPAAGPARRVYRVTDQGRAHLDEWLAVLDQLSGSLNRLVGEARAFVSHGSLMEETASR